jgi:hypothetical protein
MATLKEQTTVLVNQLSELTMPTLLVWGELMIALCLLAMPMLLHG